MKRSGDARRALQAQLGSKTNKAYIQPGLLGNAAGQVETGIDGEVFVTLPDQEIRCFAEPGIPRLAGLPVVVGFSLEQPTTLQVLSIRGGGLGISTGGGNVGNHHQQHEWPNADTVWIHGRQILDLDLMITQPFIVNIYPGWVWVNELLYFVAGASFDLTSKVPTTTGKARMIWFYVSDAGIATELDGDEVDNSLLDETTLPAWPTEAAYILGGVRLYYQQPAISDGVAGTDVLDLRFPIWHKHGPSEVVTAIFRIRRYSATTVSDYDVTPAGLTAALADAASGETVAIPPCTLAGSWSVPADVVVVGDPRTVITGSFDLANNSRLINLAINATASDTSILYCVKAPTTLNAYGYIQNCNLVAIQHGAGIAAAVLGQDGNTISYTSFLTGHCDVASQGFGVYEDGAAAGSTYLNGGSIRGDTDIYSGPAGKLSIQGNKTLPLPGGTPEYGDRGVWDTLNYPGRHASDIDAGTPTYHTPAPGPSGDIIASDGTQWTTIPAPAIPGVSGTPNQLAKFTGATTLGDSQIQEAITGNLMLTGSLSGPLQTVQFQNASGTLPLLQVNNTFTGDNLLNGSNTLGDTLEVTTVNGALHNVGGTIIEASPGSITVGSEVITTTADRDFSSDTGDWVKTEWTISGGRANLGTHTLANSMVLTVSSLGQAAHVLTVSTITTTAGTLTFSITSGSAALALTLVNTGLTSFVLPIAATDVTDITITADATWQGQIDNISLIPIPLMNATAQLWVSTPGSAYPFIVLAANEPANSLYLGNNSGQYNKATAQNNLSLGTSALALIFSGSGNTVIGHNSLQALAGGTQNTVVGYNSLTSHRSGNGNLILGSGLAPNMLHGSDNIILGISTQSLTQMRAGSNNLFIGITSNLPTGFNGNSNTLIGGSLQAFTTSTFPVSGKLSLVDIMFFTARGSIGTGGGARVGFNNWNEASAIGLYDFNTANNLTGLPLMVLYNKFTNSPTVSSVSAGQDMLQIHHALNDNGKMILAGIKANGTYYGKVEGAGAGLADIVRPRNESPKTTIGTIKPAAPQPGDVWLDLN